MKFFIFTLFFLNNCVMYLSHLGLEQMNQFMNREEIDSILENQEFDENIRERLLFVREAKKFAIKNLSLSEDSGFVYYVPLERDEVGWNVSASYPLEFKSYTWWFPIAGEVPYKGYFSYEKALEEETILKEKGLDTRIRITGGYSTLGWISDPIFSPQLDWAKPKLAGLVFHEMAHATVYIPGDSVFNESYANFIEWKGLQYYYATSNSVTDSEKEEYLDYTNNKDIKNKSIALIKKTAYLLRDLYSSNIDDKKKIQKKKKIIEEFKEEAISWKLVPRESVDKFLKKEWNNEDFIGILRYKSGKNYFEKKFQEAEENFSKFHKLVLDYKKLSKEEKEKAMEE